MTKSATPDRPAVDVSLLILRAVVGVIFFAHGAQKLFGWFEGPGLAAMVEKMGPIGYLVSVGECLGGAGIVVGFLTRFSAAANFVIMIGAIAMVHGKSGFFLAKGGYEYNLALMGLLLPIVILGPGRFSVGQFLPLPKSAATGRPILVLD